MHSTRHQRWTTTLASWLLVALMAGCETPAGPNSAARPPAPVAAPVAAAPPAPSPVVEAPPASAPPTGNPQKYVASALELLELGKEDEASAELQRALTLEPGHRLALNLLRQITADPVSVLGRESYMYRVQPGETLSRIAQRFMGDVHLFYILARYNDIKVPKLLSGGQLVRIPGKAPPAAPVANAPPSATPTAPATPAAQRASSPSDAARAEREQAERAERDRKLAVANATRAARQAFARQDLSNAIAQWDRVLELEPGNATAKLERQRAVELKDKLGRVK